MKTQLLSLIFLFFTIPSFSQHTPNHEAVKQENRPQELAELTEAEYAEFKSWVAIGPGGLPHTLEGYRSLQKFNKQLRNPLDLKYINSTIKLVGDVEALAELPIRAGERPKIAPFAIPHRQLDQHNLPIIREKQKNLLLEISQTNASRVIIKKSYFEKHNDAFFVADTTTCNKGLIVYSKGEIGHLHPSDGSMHFILSPSDAREVIEKKMGELHGLAGQAVNDKDTLASTLTMVYSPKTEDDLKIITKIAEAAIQFANKK